MHGASRWFCVFVLSVVFGCSDSSSKELGVTKPDAGAETDAARPDHPDAAPSGEPKDASTATDSSPVTTGCEDSCSAPARCTTEGGKPHCVCPEGYSDPNGDGSKCEDIDECEREGEDACGEHAKCKNKDGGFDCECEGPAYTGDGKSCECAEGYIRDSDGFCLAEDGKQCSDNLDCMNRHCVGGTCCAQRCSEPGECHTDEGATCEDGKSCVYPKTKDGTACDDVKACTAESTCQDGACVSGDRPTDCDDENPCTDDSCEEPAGCKNQNNTASCDDKDACTTDDRCQTGRCQGSPRMDCAAQSDVCNVGECDPGSGACRKTPRSASVSCDDGNSCTPMDMCSDGMCVGAGNACGINADSCMPGAPNSCTCKSGFVTENGLCVPTTNECAGANPCSPNADCFDPSSTPGDVTCTCKRGYTGNGTTCTAVDPCEGNPCGEGRGTCTASADTHTCTCNAGYVAIAGQCVCNLGGTFAARTRLDLKWADLSDQIEDGMDTTYSYSLEKHTYDASGNLSLEIVACGSTSLEACGLGADPVLAAETYTQFLPIEIWNTPSMPVVRTTISLPNALPGAAFVSEQVAALQGISLTDPKGAWPPSYTDVVGTPYFDGSAVNGAAFVDNDNDTYVGLTSYAVPPGGIRADGVPPDPMRDFGANSAVCPRMGGAHTPYAYWPAPPEGISLTPVRVKRFYTASRVISGLTGKVDSCDEISGDVVGPDGGKIRVDARIGGCVRTNGSGEAACPASVISFLDDGSQAQDITAATFKLKRLTDPNPTCAMVRAVNFD